MISTVLLAYKEEENLRVLIPKIKEVLDGLSEGYEIIVVDTKEKYDDTEDLCRKEGVVYCNQDEPGFGGAYRKGIEMIRGDKMLVLDSDGSHDPRYIPQMYDRFKGGYDVVIGSRYTEGGSTSDAKSSQVMSRILNGIYRLFLGIGVRDMSTNFRIYDASLLKEVTLMCVNYDILEEILLEMKLLRPRGEFRITEVPISFNKRIYGQSKRRLIPFILSYTGTLFRLTARRIRGKR